MNGYDLILHFINLQYFYVTVDKMASFENENASQLNQQPIQAAPAPTHQLSLKDRILASIMSVPDDEDGHADKDICRVCRLAGEDTLYHPCLCTGSIKYVHQDCLLQWLKYSKKDVCELCNHKFSFRPLYRPDMPERLPLWDLLRGVFLIFARFMRLTLTYTLVASCWLGLVPLMAARTHRLVFSGLLSSVFSSRILQLFSPENVAVDIFRGSMVVTLFLATFISLVWLREQIMIGGPANFLHLQEPIPRPSEAALPPATGNNQAAPNQPPTPPPPNNQQIGETPGVQNTQTTAPADVGPGSNEVGDMINTAGLQSSTSTGHPIPSTSAAQIDEEQTPAEDAEQSTIAPTSTPPIRQSPPPFQQFQPLQPTLVVDHPMPAGQPQQGQQPPIDNQNQQQQAQQLAQNNGNGNNGVVAAAAEMEQQRFVDELTWQRLLGLDGSFAFIEHVFWTISLNFVFNFMFLYFPAQVGTSILTLFGYGPGKTQYFEMPIAIMAGLLIILLHGLVIHRVAKMFRLKSLYTISGMICLMLKVFLLVVTELVIFPVLCGWWLDICSLPLTGVTLEERLRNFRQYPSSSMFLHWLTGMIYVFYSASFILILRELLRPGVLWFIRNLHDPDFNPIQEMIEQPVAQHVRRLISSMTLFFSIIMLVIYIPLRVIKWLHPRTLPYVFTGSADTPLVEYSFELILLQVIMPTILEYSKVFSLLKRAVHLWCRIVGGWLQLDSYLLPTDRDRQDADQREQQRQRARDRLMRGDQNEQIGLLEALEAIEDDTTEDEDGEEEEEEEEGDDENGENTGVNAGTEARANENAGQLLANGPASTSSLDNANNNNNSIVDFSSAIEVIQGSSTAADGEQQNKITINEQNIGEANDQQQLQAVQGEQPEQLAQDAEVPLAEVVAQEGVEEELNEQQQQVQLRLQEARNLGAQHHALLRFRDNNTSEDYVRPNMFPLRIVLLLFCVALTAEAIALLFFFVPVTIGRAMLSCLALTNQPVHDLYTVAAGLYTCWLLARMAMLSREWARKGWSYVKKVFSSALWLLLRIFAAALPLLVVIPFMLGFYFQMLVISPLRVAIFQSPLFFPWKEWAMGVVHFKIICASVLMGPDWWLKTAFEQIYADGIWNFRLRDLYLNLVFPIINALAFLIAYPYALSKFVLMFIDTTREEEVIVTRYSYPFLLGSICALAFLTWQWQKLKMLAQKIRNDKYLIGTQLVNFYRDSTPAVPTVTATALIEATMATATSSATKDDAAVDVGGESSAATLANNEAVATAEGNTHDEQESRAEIGGAVEVLD